MKLPRLPFVSKRACLYISLLLLGFGTLESRATTITGGGGRAVLQKATAKLKPMRVRNFRQLRRLLAAKTIQASSGGLELLSPANTRGASATAADNFAAAGPGNTHSGTNVQVEGVDEGDVVKTDGEYIYSIQSDQIRIVKAYPAGTMGLAASVKLKDGFYPSALFVEGNRLLVVGSGWIADGEQTNQTLPNSSTGSGADLRVGAMPVQGEHKTMAQVYDLSDKSKPALEREIAFSGYYMASRKVGNAVYLMARTYPRYFWLAADEAAPVSPAAMQPDTTLPRVSDSAIGGGAERPLALHRLYYFPGFVEPDYVLIAGFRLNAPTAPADIKSYLGAGDIAYATAESIYLSAADYRGDGSTEAAYSPKTHIYNFAINDGGTRFRNSGEVPGTVLNQFSMDEHKGYFRIATTVHSWIQEGDNFRDHSWNNVYTLNSAMAVTGRLEHLAEGERIYSARFMGDRAYLVTFRQVDPLFAIDLADPAAPKVLGELKIPGFSNYLHPYDAQHILGIGQETTTDGQLVRTAGVKLSLFDVSDVAQPKLKHSLVIGEQGSYTDVAYDHKALLFDKERNLLAFPIQEAAIQGGNSWYTPVFQGAHVYELTLESGFRKQAAISHQQADEKSYGYDWRRYIKRVLTIDNQLYTVSEARIQANSLTGFGVSGGVDLPAIPDLYYSPAAETAATVAD